MSKMKNPEIQKPRGWFVVRKATIWSAFLSVGISLLAVQSAQASEPEYNSKPLSEWLLILKIGQTSTGEQVEEADAQEAIRQMGTNAIPTLLDILGADDQSKWWVVHRLKSKGFREMYHNRNVPTGDLQDTAAQGLGILGTNAISTIPQLSKLFGRVETCKHAALVLAGLGPDGYAVLTNGLHNSNADIRGVTLWTIGERSSIDSNTVTRIMIAALKDPDSDNRVSAVRYLGGKDPAIAIPVLLPLLDNNKDYNSDIVSRALSSYGAAAKIAIPKLLSLFTNAVFEEDRQLAQIDCVELMWALKAIDMEAAAQAEQLLVNSGPLNSARKGYTRTLLPNGKELIAGGYVNTTIITITNSCLSSAELLDPKTGKWTETGEMTTSRDGHMAVLLRDGKVLVAGGWGRGLKGHAPPELTSAELYDPVTGQWTATGSMHDPHLNERMALQRDGKVLVYSGGFDRYPILGHELYDPTTGAWTVITNK